MIETYHAIKRYDRISYNPTSNHDPYTRIDFLFCLFYVSADQYLIYVKKDGTVLKTGYKAYKIYRNVLHPERIYVLSYTDSNISIASFEPTESNPINKYAIEHTFSTGTCAYDHKYLHAYMPEIEDSTYIGVSYAIKQGDKTVFRIFTWNSATDTENTFTNIGYTQYGGYIRGTQLVCFHISSSSLPGALSVTVLNLLNGTYLHNERFDQSKDNCYCAMLIRFYDALRIVYHNVESNQFVLRDAAQPFDIIATINIGTSATGGIDAYYYCIGSPTRVLVRILYGGYASVMINKNSLMAPSGELLTTALNSICTIFDDNFIYTKLFSNSSANPVSICGLSFKTSTNKGYYFSPGIFIAGSINTVGGNNILLTTGASNEILVFVSDIKETYVTMEG